MNSMSNQSALLGLPSGIPALSAVNAPVQLGALMPYARRRRVGSRQQTLIQIPTNFATMVPGSLGGVANPLAVGGAGCAFAPIAVDPNLTPWGGLGKFAEALSANPNLFAVDQVANKVLRNSVLDAHFVGDGGLIAALQAVPPHTIQQPHINWILDFSSSPSNDQYAEALSPDLGGPIEMVTPVHAIYQSPTHFVETMKILATSGNVQPGTQRTATCENVRALMPELAVQPYASVIRSAADGACPVGEWFTLEARARPGQFWIYLWIALWAKYQQKPGLRNVLLNTEGKALMFVSESKLYGLAKGTTVARQNQRRGLNVAGVMLMLMRGVIRSGYMDGNPPIDPVALYEKFVFPVLRGTYGDSIMSAGNKPAAKAAAGAAPGAWFPWKWFW
jgi:hypothetical protein